MPQLRGLTGRFGRCAPPLNPLRSLAGRLALIVAGAVTGALLLATGLSAWREVDRYAADKRDALRMTAQVIAAAAAGATARSDEAAALATLRAVAGDGAVIYAAIEDGNGILAEQGIGLRLSDDIDLDKGSVSPLDLMTTRTLRVSVPVIETARAVGRVVIVSDSRDLAARIGEVARTALVAGLLALGLGLGVSLRLQRSVTRPLAALATTMDGVRRHHDYTQRATIQGGEEVEGLAKTFNALLGAVNERDRAIAEHGAGLEREVALRTADLFEAKQSADAANAAKSTFLATMSHEIRTPMNGMLVMAELLANAELPPRQQRYAKVIARSGQSLLAIINDILDFAKVEAGKLEVERIPVSPRDVADTVVTLFGERAPRRRPRPRRASGARCPRDPPGRSGAPRAGARQLRLERPQVHRRRPRPRPDGDGGRRAPHQRHRHRHRHPGRQARPDLHRLLPGRSIDHPPVRRHRARPVDRRAADRGNGRKRRRREPDRRGLDLLGAPPGGRRRAR